MSRYSCDIKISGYGAGQAGLAKNLRTPVKSPLANQFLELYHGNLPSCFQTIIIECGRGQHEKFDENAAFVRLVGN